ncbi:MAG: MmcQ/YjbR family DNA-binding protein [Bacteroidetes bacterium]|jgi:predicted DNA-binding protein (MmcQ/YjbR family)|nr:MmcQ/YjbR family DNA-binding protein [Bacteroidota bacterium]
MNIELFREHCIAKKGIEETFPFDNDTLVFKVMGKMFALISISDPTHVNLKCNPEFAVELRQKFEAVKPGFHMNKTSWNTVTFNMDANDKLILEWLDLSYNLVIAGLTKKMQKQLAEM